MVSAFEMLHTNRGLRTHWLKRISAFLFDFIILSVPIAIASLFLRVDILTPLAIVSFSVVLVLYSFLLESTLKATIGKKLLGLEVAGVRGSMDPKKALIRNVPRFMGVVFIDWMLGLVTEGDPRQRYMDRLAGTTVMDFGNPRLAQTHYFTKASLLGRKGSGPLKSACTTCGSAMIEDIEGKHCPKCGLKKFLQKV